MADNIAEFVLKVRDESGKVVEKFADNIDDLVKDLNDLKKAGDKAGKAPKKVGDESNEAASKTDKLKNSVNGLNGRLGKLVGVAVAAVGALKGLGAVSETAKKFDELSNNAERLGISITDLQAAQSVALRVGNVEDFTAGLDDLNERLQDFVSNGAGEAVDVLNRFNLDAEELARKNPLEQLLTISDALEGISANDRSQLLDQLGSDNLRQLEPLLRNGREEFERLTQAAKDSGAVISEIDAIQLSKLGDSIKRTEGIFTGLFDRVAALFAPFFIKVLDGFASLADGAGLFEKAITGIGLTVVTLVGSIANAFEGIRRVFKGLELAAKVSIAEILKTADNAQGGLARFFGRDEGFFKGLSESAKKAQQSVAETRQELFDLAETPLPSENLLDTFARSAEQAQKEVEKAKQAREAAALDTNGASRGVDESEDKAKEKELQEAAEKAAKLISEARQKVADIKAQAEKEAEQFKLDEQIKRIKNETALRIKALNQQKALEQKSAEEVARERIKIETEANNRVRDLRQKVVQADIDLLNSKLSEQLKINEALEDGSVEQVQGLVEIERLQNQIATKERQRVKIADEIARANAVISEELLNQIAVENKKDSDKQAQERLKQQRDDAREQARIDRENERKAQEAARKQAEIDKEVAQARLDLLRLEGNEVDANLIEIENRYKDLLGNLEQSSEEAAIVEKLINKSKAKAQLDGIQEELERLERRFNRGEISSAEFEQEFEPRAQQARTLAESIGDPALVEDLNQKLTDTANRLDSAFQAGAVAGQAFQNNFVNAFSSILDGTKSVEQAFRDMAAQILAELAKMIIQQTIFNSLAGATGGFAGGFLSVFSGGQFHSGGAVGFGGGKQRDFNPAWLGFSQVLHTGGPVLAPDEVPAVLQKGEFVLSKSDPRNPLNADQQTSQGGQSITIQNTLDNNSVVEAINGSAGERVIQNAVRAMRDEIRNF